MLGDPLNILGSVPDPTALTGNELGKSRTTRRRILDAARDLLADVGYHGFSTGAVAARADLTRPAMLYHFGSRLELITAVVHHLARRRIEMFEDAMSGLDLPPSYKGQAYRAAAAELAWNQLETPEFIAFTELQIAARTDPALAAVVRPAVAAFDVARRITSEKALPPGSFDREDLQLARDVVRFLSEGVMVHDSIVENREARIAALRHFARMLVAS
ncbi:MAG: TetR/AcrR family transcriptional regulator, partial [Sandaracinobacteroides sp.]